MSVLFPEAGWHTARHEGVVTLHVNPVGQEMAHTGVTHTGVHTAVHVGSLHVQTQEGRPSTTPTHKSK